MTEYQHHLNALREKYFLCPEGENAIDRMKFVSEVVLNVVQHQGGGPTYERILPKPSVEAVLNGAQIPQFLSLDPSALCRDVIAEIGGSVKANHPYMLKNIIPPPSLVYLACNLAVSTYMPNAVSGEDAANTLNCEIKIAKIYSELAGYAPQLSGGLFTFGGTGTNLYAIKMGISKAQPSFMFDGSEGNLVVVGSKPAHYSHQTAANWLGIGRNNYITARSNLDQTTNLDDLERICRDQIKHGKKIVCIMGVGGTTSNMAIDDFANIAAIRDRLVRDYKLEYSPHVHADSVLGWAYLHFVPYDFVKNSLGFSAPVLQKIARVVQLIKTLKYADSFGIDFHKTGYTPYVSSMIVARNMQDLANLGRDSEMMTPLFHDKTAYNPGKFSLETSRSAANMVATWMTIQSFGLEGYQTLLGHAQEMSELIRNYIDNNAAETGLYVVNRQSYGSDVFIRCYPPGTDPVSTFMLELNDDILLSSHTTYNSNFFKWLSMNNRGGPDAIDISKTSAAFYTNTGAPMVALRVYILNPFVDEQTSIEAIDRIIKAKKAFDKQGREIEQKKL